MPQHLKFEIRRTLRPTVKEIGTTYWKSFEAFLGMAKMQKSRVTPSPYVLKRKEQECGSSLPVTPPYKRFKTVAMRKLGVQATEPVKAKTLTSEKPHVSDTPVSDKHSKKVPDPKNKEKHESKSSKILAEKGALHEEIKALLVEMDARFDHMLKTILESLKITESVPSEMLKEYPNDEVVTPSQRTIKEWMLKRS